MTKLPDVDAMPNQHGAIRVTIDHDPDLGAFGRLFFLHGPPSGVSVDIDMSGAGRFVVAGITQDNVINVQPEFLDPVASTLGLYAGIYAGGPVEAGNGAPRFRLVDPSTGEAAGWVLAKLVQLQGELIPLRDLVPDPADPIDQLLEHLGMKRLGDARDVLLAALVQSGVVPLRVLWEGVGAAMHGWTIAFGLAGNVGFGIGAGVGVGVYLGADGSCGTYDSIGVDVGAVAGIAAGVAIMGVKGPPSAFGGYARAVTLAGGVGFWGVSGALLINMGDRPYGFAGTMEFGVSAPVQAYESISHTRLQEL